MKEYLKWLLVIFVIAFGAKFSQGQASPYNISTFKAQTFTASGQTGQVVQLNGLTTPSSTVGSSFASGCITLTGTSLTTVTFQVMGSADSTNYFPLPVIKVGTTTFNISQTATANGLYCFSLAGVAYVKFTTSGTFTATAVSFLMTASPNASVGSNAGSGGGIPPAPGGIQYSTDGTSFQLATPAQVQEALAGPATSSDLSPITTAANVALWTPIPDCHDPSNALAYNRSTHSYVCQTISGGGGASFPATEAVVVNTSTTTSRNANQGDISVIGSNSPMAAPLYYFSDSQGVGVGSTAYIYATAGVLAASHGGTFTNISGGGNESTDWAVTVAQNMPYGLIPPEPNSPLAVWILQGGINNYNGCGVTAACLDSYQRSIAMALSWAGATGVQAHRVYPANMTLSGGFSINSATYGIPVALSTTLGDTASGTVVTTGNPIGIDYVITNTNTGQISCTVDGGSPTIINEYVQSGGNIGGNHTFSFFRTEIPASVGSHAVVCTTANNTGSGNFAGIIAYDSIPAGITNQLPLGIMSNAPGISGSNIASTITFNAAVTSVFNQYVAEGLNFTLFDFNTISNSLGVSGYTSGTTTPNCPGNGAGGLHFNNCIHLATALGYVSQYPQIFQFNAGASQLTVQSYGGVSNPDTSYYTHCDKSASFTSTGVNCGYYVYPGQGIDFGAFGASYPLFQSPGGPVERITGGNICLGSPPPYPATAQSQWPAPYLCLTSGQVTGWVSTGGLVNGVPTGTVTASTWRPWVVAHDNIKAYTATSALNSATDEADIGPLTHSININLPLCQNFSGIVNAVRAYVRRIGTDGNAITFIAQSPDTINGLTSYTWSATEPDWGYLRCSTAGIGGETWAFTPSTIHPFETPSISVDNALSIASDAITAGTFSNLVSHSSELTDPNWEQQLSPANQFVVTGGQTDPQGGTTAITLTTGTGTANAGNYIDSGGTPLTVGAQYCVSAWIKGAVGGETNWYIGIGNVGNLIPPLTTTWTQYAYNEVLPPGGPHNFEFSMFPFPATTPETAYIAYPQVTPGKCPANIIYTPTTTSSIAPFVAVKTPLLQADIAEVGVELVSPQVKVSSLPLSTYIGTDASGTIQAAPAPNIGVIGNVQLTAGTATVSTPAAVAVTVGNGNSGYQLTRCATGGTAGDLSIGSITPGSSFVINSSSPTDTSTVCWRIQ